MNFIQEVDTAKPYFKLMFPPFSSRTVNDAILI